MAYNSKTFTNIGKWVSVILISVNPGTGRHTSTYNLQSSEGGTRLLGALEVLKYRIT
jgi:hypothetical protein